MEISACYLCGSARFEIVNGRVRDRPTIGILRCIDCGLVFLDSLDHVSEGFYESAYTEENHPDLGWQQLLDVCKADDERRLTQILPLVSDRRYLDVGCGVGGVLLRACSHCVSCAGVEPQSRWRKDLQEHGIPVKTNLDEIEDGGFDVISLFHVLEHIPDPIPFMNKVRAKLAPNGLLFIEVPNANDALLQLYQCKAFSEFTYWSPHVFLYNASTLALLLKKSGLANDARVDQFQRYPLSNHLMWLARGKPGGHEKWSFLDSPETSAAYAARLAAIGMCDTLIAIVRPDQS